MTSKRVPWYVAGSLVLPATVLAGRLYTRFRRDIRAAYTRLDMGGSQVIETACGRIEYATFGSGYPILVIHGNCGGFDQGITSARPVLGDGFRAIVPSRFGYLRTPLPPNASAPSQADAYACLLDQLGVDRAAVIGYSAGSTSTIQFALRYPERVWALVLSSPNAPGKEPALPPRMVFRLLFGSNFLFWLITTYFSAGVRTPMGIPKGYKLTAEDQAAVEEMMRTTLPVAARAAGVLFDTYVSNPDINSGYPFERITTPTLVLSAHDDPMAPYENARSLAERIPGAQLVSLESGGHLMLGQAERTCTAIRSFLQEHATREGESLHPPDAVGALSGGIPC